MSTPIKSLPEWLNAATNNLSAPAKERIKLEIESHFQQAIESHCAEGVTEGQAQTRALAELGDAKAAAKSFRKTYLTATEAIVIGTTLNRYRRVSVQCYHYGGYLLGFVVGYYILKKQHAPLIFPAILAIIILTFQTICLWGARWPVCRSSVRLFFTLQMLIWFTTMTLCGCYLQWGFGFLIFITIMSTNHLESLRLWFKIQRAHDLGWETPPVS